MDKVIESFIDQCDDMMIAEEGLGDVMAGVVFAPVIIMATVAAIVAIGNGIRNIKETTNGTHPTAKLYRSVTTSNYEKYVDGVRQIDKFLDAYNSFNIPKTVYENAIFAKKANEHELEKRKNIIDVIIKNKPNLNKINSYIFNSRDNERDAITLASLDKLNASINTAARTCRGVNCNIKPVDTKGNREMMILSSSELKTLLHPNETYAKLLKELMDIADDAYLGRDFWDTDWYAKGKSSLLLYISNEDYTEGNWYNGKDKVPMIEYYEYSMNVADLTWDVLHNITAYIRSCLKVISHCKANKKDK